MTLILGEMDVARVNPCRFGQGQPPMYSVWLGSNPASQRRSANPGDRIARSVTCPVNDVHQVRIMNGVGGWGMTCRGDKIGIGDFHSGV